MIGSAADIADTMEQWIDAGAADGFMIQATHVPAAFEDFATQVVPSRSGAVFSAPSTRGRPFARTWDSTGPSGANGATVPRASR